LLINDHNEQLRKMPQTGSILTDTELRGVFGELVHMTADYQKLDPKTIAHRLNRMEGGERSRLPDWSRYRTGQRIPSPLQLAELARALRLPEAALRVCAGYVDDIFKGVYCAVNRGLKSATFSNRRPTRRAAFALLFSLFPTNDMPLGRTCSLLNFVVGRVVALNLTQRRGFVTGEDWTSAWLFPMPLTTEMLILNRPDPTLQLISVPGNVNTKGAFYSVRALGQVDIASPVAKNIILGGTKPIPKSDLLFEAMHLLHIRRIPLETRVEFATELIHLWANDLDREMAEGVRNSLQPWRERTLTSTAVAFIKGRRKRAPERIWV
jgi:hypothetical protein